MTCQNCDKTAHYEAPTRQGKQFFCSDHKDDAVALLKRELTRNERAVPGSWR